MVHVDFDKDFNVTFEGDFWISEIMFAFEQACRKLSSEDGIPWTVHLANMYKVIAKEEMSDEEVQKVVDSTLEGRIYNG